jgi:hypothetical protein
MEARGSATFFSADIYCAFGDQASMIGQQLANKSCDLSLLTFALLIFDAVVRSSLPHDGLFPYAIYSFVIDTKTVDTCFYMRMIPGIFNLANFTRYVLPKYEYIFVRFFSTHPYTSLLYLLV